MVQSYTCTWRWSLVAVRWIGIAIECGIADRCDAAIYLCCSMRCLAIGSAQPCVSLQTSYNILLDFRWMGETTATLSCYGNVKWRHEFTISHLSWLFVRKVQRNVARVAPLFIRVLSSSFYSQFARNFPFSISFECLAAWWLRIRHQMQIEVEALKKF